MQKKSLSHYWLIIGVAALAVAGLYSLVLAGGRSPKLGESSLLHRIFHEALVVHVDLSVLVWFLAMACLLWSLMTRGARAVIPYMEEAALISFALGAIAITLSPLDPMGEALMSNYIPVIHSPVFFMGLMLVLCGAGLMAVRVLTSPVRGEAGALAPGGGEFIGMTCPLPAFGHPLPLRERELYFALYAAALITLIAFACFVWAFWQIPPVIDGQQYYEILFWGGGHVLQFTHTQVMMVAWVVIMFGINSALKGEIQGALPPPPLRGRAGVGGEGRSDVGASVTPHPTLPLKGGGLYVLFSIGLLAAFIAPLPYLMYDIVSAEHREFFTWQMIVMGGIAPSILLLMLLPSLWRARGPNALWSALVMSFVLFAYGGILGGMIQGQNVVIPAHYHGSIVGVTLAFMGLAYLLLPKLGYADVARWRTAFWQPIIYGIGQIMHVSGFAWSGGYGALRKTPGGSYEGAAQIAMGLMGGGAGLAAIGGLMFVVVVAKAMMKKG